MSAMKRQRTDADEWDTRIGTGAHSTNVVLREAGRPLTLNEILTEVRRRGLPTTNAPDRHLYRLEGRQKDRPTAYIRKNGDRWVPLEFTKSNNDNVATSGVVSNSESSSRAPIPECDQARDITTILTDSQISETSRKALVDARLGQGKFRESVLRLWDRRCAVTDSTIGAAIRASHIKPWRDATNEERLDEENGIPLIASLDALFDLGWISFYTSGRMIFSEEMSPNEREIFAISNAALRKVPSPKMARFLAEHRKAHGFEC